MPRPRQPGIMIKLLAVAAAVCIPIRGLTSHRMLIKTGHIQALATDGIPNAMALIQGASTAFGDAAAAGGVWSFPNTEARDLAGKIFGKVSSPPDYYAAVKSITSVNL